MLCIFLFTYYQRVNISTGFQKINSILKFLTIIDVIFLVVMYFVWIKNKESSEYWSSLYNIHLMIYLIALVEIGIKVMIILKIKE